MDIRNWGLHQIMQLPDSVFGRRYCVSCAKLAEQGATVWDISEIALPERAVLWEVTVFASTDAYSVASMRIALGDQQPTTAAMMSRLEPLIPGLGYQGPDPRYIHPYAALGMHLVRLKMPIATMGRRLVLETTAVDGANGSLTLATVWSAVPNEVPDCLISG